MKGATGTNAVFGLVLGLIGWIYLEAVVVIIAAEVNAVRTEQLYPRALLTPFTDNVDLTDGDRRAYAGAAQAQASKGFENVRVTFGKPDRQDEPSRTAATPEPEQQPRSSGARAGCHEPGTWSRPGCSC